TSAPSSARNRTISGWLRRAAWIRGVVHEGEGGFTRSPPATSTFTLARLPAPIASQSVSSGPGGAGRTPARLRGGALCPGRRALGPATAAGVLVDRHSARTTIRATDLGPPGNQDDGGGITPSRTLVCLNRAGVRTTLRVGGLSQRRKGRKDW